MELMGLCPPSWQELYRKGSFDGIDGIDGGFALLPGKELCRKGSFDGMDGIDGGFALLPGRNCLEKARLMEWMELTGGLPSFLAGTV